MERDFKGVWIPKEFYLNRDLSWAEKILLFEIDSLDNFNEKSFELSGHLVSGGIFAHNIPFFHHLLPTWPDMVKEFLFGLGVGIVVLLPVMLFQKLRKKSS